MDRHILLFLFAVLVSAFGQVFLKKGAMNHITSLWRQYFNPWVIFGYFLFFIALALNSVAYRGIPLKIGPVLDSTGFIFVPCLSWFFFREKLTKLKITGFFLIWVGILVSAW